MTNFAAMSTPTSIQKAAGEVELRKVERLLERLAPDCRQSWTSLLNALLVEAESQLVRAPVVHSLQSAIVTLARGDAATLQKPLNALIQAARLPIDTNPRTEPDEKGNTTVYSLGAGMADMVAHLRFDLGLSALYVCRHLRGFHGAPTPPGALLACVAGVKPESRHVAQPSRNVVR